MQEQEKLKTGIGTKEAEVLKPGKVKVEKIEISEVSFANKKQDKVNLICKHPDSETTITISKAKILKKDKLVFQGLWFSLDSDNKLVKNSVTSEVLRHYEVSYLEDLKGKELDTVQDDEGYLVIKAYK